MDELSLWPDLDSDESTTGAFEFIRKLREELKSKYEGKIDCSFDEIIYQSSSLNWFHHQSIELRKAMSPVQERSQNEKNKKEVCIPLPKECKFVLFNDAFFFRVFDVKIGAFFPVEIRPNEGIVSGQSWDYEEVDSASDFREKVLGYLNSKYVKDVIRYMIQS